MSDLRWIAVRNRCVFALLTCVLAMPAGLRAQMVSAPQVTYRANDPRPDVLRDIGLDQRLNEQVPLDTTFRDETGRGVRLGDYFGRRPVILALVYYQCPMLCGEVLNGLTSALTALKFSAGKEFEVVTVSIDPSDSPQTASAKKEFYVRRYRREGAGAGWHFLTGDQPSIDAITRAVGFRYKYDEPSQQFMHASGVMLLTPEGRLSRYFYGIEYAPRDLQLGLVEASHNKIGGLVEQVLLFCYHYDPRSAKYTPMVLSMVRAGGIATVLVLGTFIGMMLRKESQQKKEGRAA
jgi:protein SCO1/2